MNSLRVTIFAAKSSSKLQRINVNRVSNIQKALFNSFKGISCSVHRMEENKKHTHITIEINENRALYKAINKFSLNTILDHYTNFNSNFHYSFPNGSILKRPLIQLPHTMQSSKYYIL